MSTDLSRRAFVVSTVTTGFALAVSPVSAETITTDTAGLVAGDVKIGAMPAYRAVPDGKGPFPLVLVVHEIFGVHEHIKDVCRRLAKAGYMAIAPELFARQGDVSKLQGFEEILKVVSKVPDAQVMSDLDAAVAWAKKTGKVDGDRVAITGFCWGGRIVWLYAARSGVKTGAAWYGRLSHAVNANQTKTPLDVGATLKVPVLGLYGGQDSGIPVSHVELMRRELASGKSGSEIVVYPDAGHAFYADYRPSYAKAAADDAWTKMLAWLKKNGV
ncbi:MAG: dienelactone hydrolase family protein [Labilithrix sp.]|nr:dienelactone hydrolase family protein [Labilithrix sp.]MCW5832606.1 dienelactone hydrolase family protein [Labilithrix sp.]